MNTDELQVAMDSDAFLGRVEDRFDTHFTSGRIMARVGLTPDRHFASEVHDRRIFATEADARFVDRGTGFLMGAIFAGIIATLPATYLTTLAFGEVWYAFVAGLLGPVIGLPYLALKAIDRIFRRPSRPVSVPMVTAWTHARRHLSAMNEENTVPAILEKMQALEVEMNTIAATYDDLVGEVDREQAEVDFVLAASLVEALSEVAKVSRDKLYSTRRASYLLATA